MYFSKIVVARSSDSILESPRFNPLSGVNMSSYKEVNESVAHDLSRDQNEFSSLISKRCSNIRTSSEDGKVRNSLIAWAAAIVTWTLPLIATGGIAAPIVLPLMAVGTALSLAALGREIYFRKRKKSAYELAGKEIRTELHQALSANGKESRITKP